VSLHLSYGSMSLNSIEERGQASVPGNVSVLHWLRCGEPTESNILTADFAPAATSLLRWSEFRQFGQSVRLSPKLSASRRRCLESAESRRRRNVRSAASTALESDADIKILSMLFQYLAGIPELSRSFFYVGV